MRNVLLTIAYDGTGYAGWQRQPDKKTVQGELERVLSVLCAEDVTIEGTSRTDAGVHALGQRATLRGNFAIPAERIPQAANGLLSADAGPFGIGGIRILKAEEMPEGFHARFDARGKTYLYRIGTGPDPDLFRRNETYYLEKHLDVNKMREAAKVLIGEHDFKSFQASGGNEVPSTVKTITGIRIAEETADNLFGVLPFEDGFSGSYPSTGLAGRNLPEEGGEEIRNRLVLLEFTGSGFLYHMVRNIVGTLVEIGQGKKEPSEMTEILGARDRAKAGHTAPPQGLFLKEIYY